MAIERDADPVAIDLSRRKLAELVGGEPTSDLLGYLEFLTAGDMVVWEDDFIGDTLHGSYGSNADTGATAAAIVADQLGGISRLVTGATNDEGADLSLDLNFRADHNPVIAVRLSLSSASAVKAEVGFTDATNDNGAVNSLSSNSFTATDAAVWVYDTDDTGNTSGWQGAAADGGTAGAITKFEPTGLVGPTAATYETMVVALQREDEDNNVGVARFLRFDVNNRLTTDSGWQAGAISSNVLLTPWVYVQTRDTNSVNLDIDYIKVWQRRTNSKN
jgi:hypothetical protein